MLASAVEIKTAQLQLLQLHAWCPRAHDHELPMSWEPLAAAALSPQRRLQRLQHTCMDARDEITTRRDLEPGFDHVPMFEMCNGSYSLSARST